jgi:hypothetical protein
MKLTAIRDAGHDLLWVEDPIVRHDFEGAAYIASCGQLDPDQ